MTDKKESATAAAAEVGKDMGKALSSNLRDEFYKALAEADKKAEAQLRERERVQKEADDIASEALAETTAELESYFDEQERLRQEDLKDAQEKAKAKVEAMYTVANATSSILGTIADMYEADEESSEKNANKIKGLRIASATIDTISGAIGAFMQAVQTIPPPLGAIVGGVQAAAVTAAGIAQISKLKATKVSASASGSNPTAPAVTSAPVQTMDIKQVRSVTSASEEERLNQMASEQRVYILQSDIEASQNAVRTQVAEASF